MVRKNPDNFTNIYQIKHTALETKKLMQYPIHNLKKFTNSTK